MANPSTGLGQALAAAEAGEFFGWFHLAPDPGAPVPPAPQAAWRFYRPSGARFHAQTQLAARVDREGRVIAAVLGVDRAFIDDASIRPFARDLVRSFLVWALPPAAAAGFAPRLDALGRFGDEERVIRSASAPAWSFKKLIRAADEDDFAAAFIGAVPRAAGAAGGVRIGLETLAGPLPADVSLPPSAPGRPPDAAAPAWLRVSVAGDEP